MSTRGTRRILKPVKRVALIIESQVAPRRRMLEGVARYVQQHGPWNMYLKPRGVDHSIEEWATKWDGDGVIAAISVTGSQHLVAAGIPVVDLVGRLPGAPLVHTDDAAVGRLAAEHLLARGYRDFGFIGFQDAWSKGRLRGFEERVREFGIGDPVREFLIIRPPSSGPLMWERQQADFVEWVRGLPKPVGVMTCTDMVGQQFLEACSRAGVAVPEQVAVIGADNDDLICGVANPPLSSVIINDFQRGYRAAALLDQLMAGQPAPDEVVWVQPAGVVGRASTDMLAIADQAVAEALRFIRKHACEGIGVADVIEQVPLSRSMLERRFRKSTGRSMNDEIVRVRLDRAIELLSSTDMELKAIASRTGFRTATYMGSVFRTRLKRSAGSYRGRSARSTQSRVGESLTRETPQDRHAILQNHRFGPASP